MNAMLLPRSVLALGLGSMLCAQAPKPVARTVEDVLPASTYAVARFGGLEACRESAGAVPMSAIVNAFLAKIPAETRSQYFEKGLDDAAEHVQGFLQHLGVGAADLRAVLSCPMALAMGRLTIEGRGPSVALVMDAGDRQAAVERVIAILEGRIVQQGHQLASSEVDIGGTKVRQLTGSDVMPSIFLGNVGGFYVVTNSRGYLRDMGEVLQGKQPKLAADSGLGADLRRLPAPALASMFANTRSLCSMFDAHLPYETAEFAQALGLGRLDSLYFGTTASAQGGSDVMHIGLEGSADGLFKAITGKPADLEFAKMCSKNTVLFASGCLDVPAVVDAFDHFLGMLPAGARTEARREMGREFGRELRHLGTTPQEVDALLRAFGNQVSLAIGLEKGAFPKPELLVRLAVRDRAHIAPLLAKLEAMVTNEAGFEWKSRQVGDAEVRFCNVESDDMPFKISPCYVLTDKALVIGSDTAGLVRALRQADKADDSFAAQPDFAAMAESAKGASGILHLRLFRAAELGWRTVEQLAYPQLDEHKEQIGFGSDSLPDAEAMAKALGTSTFLYQVDAAGFLVKAHGTLAFGSVLAALGAAVDEVLLRAGGKIY